MILVIDNFDSFVHNLARYLRRLGLETQVVRNNVVTPQTVTDLSPAAIILSPGPGTPSGAGRSLEIVRRFAHQCPMLGVCLGHQTIAAAFGGRIVRAHEPVHGRSSPLHHSGQSIFSGLPNPLHVGRYHSLVVDAETLPSCLLPLAHATDGTLMAFEHVELPLIGVQFHPESVLTERGYDLLAAFLRRVGLNPQRPDTTKEWTSGASSGHAISKRTRDGPTHPITF